MEIVGAPSSTVVQAPVTHAVAPMTFTAVQALPTGESMLAPKPVVEEVVAPVAVVEEVRVEKPKKATKRSTKKGGCC